MTSPDTRLPTVSFPDAGTLRGLPNTVLARDYCIGCGACAALPDSGYSITWDERGLLQAAPDSDDSSPEVEHRLGKVCPFASEATDETTLAQRMFGGSCEYDERTGFYASIYAGRVVSETYYTHGSSGGLGRWLLCELLRRDLVDGVIHVEKRIRHAAGEALYQYRISSAVEEVVQTAQSAYYPVEMSEVLKEIRRRPGRYAITGVPCFMKAVRLLCDQDEVYRERIRFCVGLVCGHLKSARYADMIAWQLGVSPDDVARLDFRRKIPGRTAKEKGVAAYSSDNPHEPAKVDVVQNLYGTNYALGFFKPKACDYCDDVFAETADVVIGDAWLPQYLGQGTSLVLTRDMTLSQVLEEGKAAGELALDTLTADEASESQAGGLRHRREGLRYRLAVNERKDEWTPPKRVSACTSHLTPRYQQIFEIRRQIAELSHGAFGQAMQAESFPRFRRTMRPLLRRYERVYRGPRLRHQIGRLVNVLGLSGWLNRIRNKPTG